MSNDNQQLALVNQADAYLKKKEQQLTRWVTGGVAAEALRRFAVMEMQGDWKLRQCTPRSIYTALLGCAVTGLIPGSLKGEAYLVPFRRNLARKGQPENWVSEAKFLAGYKGLRKQALRSSMVKLIRASVVYEAELPMFDIDLGTRNEVVHKPLLTGGDRGQVVGAYAWAQLANGERQIVWMSRIDLDKVKAFANKKQESPAWKDWEERMQVKTAVRNLCSQLPMGDDYFNGVRIEADHDGADNAPTAEEVIDILTEGEVSREVGEEMETSLFTGVPPQAEQARQAGPAPEVRTSHPAQPPAATNANRRQTSEPRASNNRPIGAQAAERPAQSPGTPAAPPATTPASAAAPSASQAAPAATSPTKTGTGSPAPTNPTPATSSAGSTSSPASGPSPAASSPPSPTATPIASTESTPATSPASSADGPASRPRPSPSPRPSEDEETFGDVAGEPQDGEPFDVQFGESAAAEVDPAAERKARRAEIMESFRAWCAQHPTRDEVRANSAGWMPMFNAWLAACGSRAELAENKDEWINWCAKNYKASAREDRSKGRPEVVGDPEMTAVQKAYSARSAELL